MSARFIQIELWPEMGQQMWKLKDCPVKISGLMISIFKTKDDHLTCGVAVLLFPSFNLNLIGHFLSKGDFLIRKAITSSLPFTILKKLNGYSLKKHLGLLSTCQVFTVIFGFRYCLIGFLLSTGISAHCVQPVHIENNECGTLW